MINVMYRNILVFAAVVVAIFVVYNFLTMQDMRSTDVKVGDALQELNRGAENAAQEFKSRTPGEKLGDAVKGAAEKVKEHAAP